MRVLRRKRRCWGVKFGWWVARFGGGWSDLEGGGGGFELEMENFEEEEENRDGCGVLEEEERI